MSSTSSWREVVCPNCHSAVFTDNSVWCKCDICGERIWLDLDHPEAPPDLPGWYLEQRWGGSS